MHADEETLEVRPRRGPLIKVLDLMKVYRRNQKPPVENNDKAGERVNDRDVPTSSPEFLEADKKKHRGGNRAVNGVSFHVREGEIFSLTGLNGAGKSTTLNCMAGELRLGGGTVMIDDLNIDTVFARPHLMQGMIGYCHQFNGMEKAFTVYEYLDLLCNLLGVKHEYMDKVIGEYLEMFDLEDEKDDTIAVLSEGNQRKLMVAIAFLGHPKAVYLDEPTTGMDPTGQRVVWAGIKKES